MYESFRLTQELRERYTKYELRAAMSSLGGINARMTKPRRRAKQARHRANEARRLLVSQNKQR